MEILRHIVSSHCVFRVVSWFNNVQTYVGFGCVGQKETRQILRVENDWFLHVADVLFVFDDSKASTSNI